MRGDFVRIEGLLAKPKLVVTRIELTVTRRQLAKEVMPRILLGRDTVWRSGVSTELPTIAWEDL